MTKPQLSIKDADQLVRQAAYLAKRGGPKDMSPELRDQQVAMARSYAAATLATQFEIDLPKGKFTDKVESERAADGQRAVGYPERKLGAPQPDHMLKRYASRCFDKQIGWSIQDVFLAGVTTAQQDQRK